MHSARNGTGHDAKIRKAKRLYFHPLCAMCGHPTKDVVRHKRAVHQ